MKIGLLVFSLLIFASACSKNSAHDDGLRFEHVDLSRSASNIRLPTKLWEELEGLYHPMALDTSTQAEEGVTIRNKVPTEMFPFEIQLVEKSRGVLGGKNWEFAFERGGGALDLRDYLHSSRGTFYLRMKSELDLKDSELTVVYLSNSVKKMINQEEFGAGCNKYLEISKYWNREMAREGIPVNVTNQRHIALLGGTYFFAASKQGKLYLSQLTIKDSRFRQWRCREDDK